MKRRVGTSALVAVLTIAGAPLIRGGQVPRDQWGAPAVTVTHKAGEWIIAGQKVRVVLADSDLAIRIQAGPAAWSLAPSAAGDVLVRSNGDDFPLRLADARTVDVRPYDTGFKTGVKLTLSDWRHPGAALDLLVFLTIALEGRDEELVFDAAAQEGTTVIRQLDWPGPLAAGDVDHTVLSHYRGILLPRDWPTEFNPIRSGAAYPNEATEIQSNVIESWSMSWWGFQKGPSAMMVIVETPDDAAYQFRHPAGGPTVIGPRWRASLGRFRYPRSARMCFVAAGDYVDLAKRYRRHAMDSGLFVSLQEKIARSPRVAALVGTPLTRLSILRTLDAKHRIERTTFADGTTVTVDWDAGTYSIGRAR